MSPRTQGAHRPGRHAGRAALGRAGRVRARRDLDRLHPASSRDSTRCTSSPRRSMRVCTTSRCVSIPMFVMMGAAIGSSPAGKDLYEALDRWLYRLPGGLVISNLGACALFAALTGSSPACCAAIGKMGIPEMRRRGYPDDIATGSICAGGTLGILIPPSITFILYGIAHRDLDRPPVPRRRAAGRDADRAVHAVDAVHHLEARIPRPRRRFPLQLEARNSSRFRRSRRFSPSSSA